MEEIFQKLIEEIPDYKEFFTVQEMDEHSRELARQHPESTSIFEIGHTREGRPLLCLKIGQGDRNALMFGCPHPNEPIGAMLLEYVSQRLAESQELRDALGYTWYIVKAWDADGLVKNEGWLKGPYNIYNYGRNFFRPAGYQQVDWTFPIDYGALHFHDVLPETRAMMDLIDEIQPEFIYALHNAGFGGTYWYESIPTPEIYEELHKIPRKYQLPLSLGAAESPANTEYAPAIYKCGGIRDEYDYLIKYGGQGEAAALAMITCGDNSSSYAYEKYGSFTLLTELPYFYDPRIEDVSASDMTRIEVLQQSARETDAINQDLHRILSLSRKWLGANNPFAAAVLDFCKEGGSTASLNQAASDPAFQKPASQAEKLDQLVVSKFYKMICYGMLVRANEEELKRDTGEEEERTAALQAGYDAALEGLKAITKFLEDHLQYSVVPIRKLIAVQLESGLVVLSHLRNCRKA